MFSREDGPVIRPEYLTRRFQALARAAHLPVIRFHDLRHTNASLALAAGVPMKVVHDRLGHSSTVITADLYTHVIPAVAAEAAEAVAALVGTATGSAVGDVLASRPRGIPGGVAS